MMKAVLRSIGGWKVLAESNVADEDADAFLAGARMMAEALGASPYSTKQTRDGTREFFLEHPVSGKKMHFKIVRDVSSR